MGKRYNKICLLKAVTQKEDQRWGFKTNYRLMQAKSAILLTFIKLPSVIKIFVSSIILVWPLTTGFTVAGWFTLIVFLMSCDC